MSDTSFEGLMQRYEMGQAYKRITAEMGPSPQLLAFVNYEKITEESIGLESFDIMSQHAEILAEIDADPALAMATESLAAKIRKVSSYAMEGGAVLWLSSFLTGKFGNVGFAAMVAGAIVKKISGLPTRVFPIHAFHHYQKVIESTMELEIAIANSVPSTFTLYAWKEFSEKLDKSIKRARSEPAVFQKVAVDRSGWNEANISEAFKWTKETAERIAKLQKGLGNKLKAVEDWVETDHEGDGEAAAVLKKISNSIGLTYKVFSISELQIKHVGQILENVSHMFEDSKK